VPRPALRLRPELTAERKAALARCEEIIANDIQAFVRVGTALAHVRDERLYEAKYDSFEEYARDRWQLSRSQAYREIDGAAVAQMLSPNGDGTPVPNEAVARAMGPLKDEPDHARRAWGIACEREAQPTARIAAEAVKEVLSELGRAPQPPSPPRPLLAAVARIDKAVNALPPADSAVVGGYIERGEIPHIQGRIVEICQRLGAYREALGDASGNPGDS
jgi:hypothetical protein